MQVIGHEQEYMWPPKEVFLPMPDGFEEWCCNRWKSESVVGTFAAVDGDEVNLLLRIDPKRDVMRQSFPVWRLHDK